MGVLEGLIWGRRIACELDLVKQTMSTSTQSHSPTVPDQARLSKREICQMVGSPDIHAGRQRRRGPGVEIDDATRVGIRAPGQKMENKTNNARSNADAWTQGQGCGQLGRRATDANSFWARPGGGVKGFPPRPRTQEAAGSCVRLVFILTRRFAHRVQGTG